MGELTKCLIIYRCGLSWKTDFYKEYLEAIENESLT